MSLTGMTNEEKIWNYLESKGLSKYGIAGLMGNLYAESGLSPINLQNSFEKKLGMTDSQYVAAVDNGTYTNFVHDSAGFGLWQLTYWSRKEGFLKYVKSKGKSIGDLETQLEYLLVELKQYGLLSALKTASSVQEASNLILLKFEKPASMNSAATQTKRAGYAQTYFDKYASDSKPKKGGSGTMKYTTQTPPMQCFMRQSTWYKGAGTVPVRGVLWHCTGANNPMLKRYVQPDDNAPDRVELLKLLGTNSYRNDWNHIARQAGVHAWIGKLASGEVTTVQVGPWDKKAWGCSSGKKGSCNNGWIQFEICEDALTDRAYFDKVYREGVELTAYLCKLYGLNPKGTVSFCGVNVPVILCHQDSYKLGLGGNHADVYNWFNKFGKTMDDVRNDVAILLAQTGTTTPVTPAPTTATTSSKVPYTVRITATDLNIRSGPGINNTSKGHIKPGVYTITEEAYGKGATKWGKLKSGFGWVSLDFCKKLS